MLTSDPWKWVSRPVILVVILLFSQAFAQQSQSLHSQTARLGVLVDLHEPGGNSSDCGPLNPHVYQKLRAVEWALDVINNKSWPGEFFLELAPQDTCGDGNLAVSETAKLLKGNKESLIGLIVIGSRDNERIIDRPLEVLNKENVSAIVTSSKAASLILADHPNVFTTAPDLSSVAEGVVALVNQLGASDIAVISSNSQSVRKLQKLSSSLSINATKALMLPKDVTISLSEIVQFLEGPASGVQSVVLLLESSELESLLGDDDSEAVSKFKALVTQKSWILGSVGVNSDLVKEWSSKFFVNLLLLQPRASSNPEFNEFFVNRLIENIKKDEPQASEYVELMYNCRRNRSKKRSNILNPPCRNLTKAQLLRKLQHESDVGFIMNAVSAYSAALRLAQLSCNETTTCDNLPTSVLGALRSLNLPVKDISPPEGEELDTVSSSHEIEGTQRRINSHGKLISRKYDLLLVRNSGKMSKIGQYSHEEGLVLDVMLGLNLEGGSSMQLSEGQSPRKGKASSSSSDDVRDTNPDPVLRRHLMSAPELYISRGWAMTATAFSITGVFISLYMLVYVLQRMCDGTLRGNQVLGVLLLLGIILLFSSVVLFVLPPGHFLCTLRVFLPSLATATCYGILLLKAMQLRSLVSLGLGGRIPAINQALSLLFIIAPQLALNLQFFLGQEGQFQASSQSAPSCPFPPETFLYLHSYLGLLLLLVFIYGLSVLKIRRNYNEAKWITLASCLSLPFSVAWIIIVQLGPTEWQDPAACGIFISLASILLFSIFIPKLNTISQQGKEPFPPGSGSQHPNGPGGSISTIFTTLSDRGTLSSSQKKLGGGGKGGKQVTYSPRLTTNLYHTSSPATSLARSVGSGKPFFHRAAYP